MNTYVDFPDRLAQRVLAIAPLCLLLATFALPPWWPHWPWAAGFALLCAVWAWRLWRAPGIKAITWLREDQFRLHLSDGSEPLARLGSAFVHPRLLALRFVSADGGPHRLIVPLAKRQADHYRHLRVILLHQAKRSEAPASPGT